MTFQPFDAVAWNRKQHTILISVSCAAVFHCFSRIRQFLLIVCAYDKTNLWWPLTDYKVRWNAMKDTRCSCCVARRISNPRSEAHTALTDLSTIISSLVISMLVRFAENFKNNSHNELHFVSDKFNLLCKQRGTIFLSSIEVQLNEQLYWPWLEFNEFIQPRVEHVCMRPFHSSDS